MEQLATARHLSSSETTGLMDKRTVAVTRGLKFKGNNKRKSTTVWGLKFKGNNKRRSITVWGLKFKGNSKWRSITVWAGLASSNVYYRRWTAKWTTSVRFPASALLSLQKLRFMDTVTLPLTINETQQWLSSLPILMQGSFWWWQCSFRYNLPLPSPIGISFPSSICDERKNEGNIMGSVDKNGIENTLLASF